MSRREPVAARRYAALRMLQLAAAAIGVALAATAHGQSFTTIFSAGNQAYFRGDYATAATDYERLVQANVRDPDVYFNLGLAHARLGHLGAAILSFERCLWLRAGDDVAESELTKARALLGARRAEREGEATVQARPPLSHALVGGLSADGLAVFVLIVDVLLFGVLLLRPRVRREAVALGLAIATPLLALLFVAAGLGLLVKLGAFQKGEAAIVLREKAELREGPDRNAQVRAVAREGESAEVGRRAGAFVEVRLPSGNRGWINAQDVGLIRPH